MTAGAWERTWEFRAKAVASIQRRVLWLPLSLHIVVTCCDCDIISILDPENLHCGDGGRGNDSLYKVTIQASR